MNPGDLPGSWQVFAVVVGAYGFPIYVTTFLLIRMEKQMARLADATAELTAFLESRFGRRDDDGTTLTPRRR